MINRKIKAIVIDNNQFVGFAFKEILGDSDFIELVKISKTTSTLHETVIREKIELLIIDIEIIRNNRNDIINVIKDEDIDIKIVVLLFENDYINSSNISVDGVIDKSSDLKPILSMLKLVVYGFQCVPKKYLKQDVNSMELLTKREREIFRYIINGMSNRDIANNLNISSRTVSVHRFNIMFKMGIKNPMDLLELSNNYMEATPISRACVFR